MLANPQPADPLPADLLPADPALAHPLAAVLFDMDGLLVDTEHSWGVAEVSVKTWLGHPYWSEEEQGQMVGGPISRVATYMKQVSGSDLTADEIEEKLVQTMADLLRGGADHRPGAARLLDDLVAHGVPCALVSSSPRNLVDAVLASVGGGHFTTTIAGDEVARTKPFPDPYLLACSRLGVEPAHTVVLEDSPVGVAAAEAAGCLVVAVPFVVPIESGPRRHVVGSLGDLDTAVLRQLLSDDLGAPATRS